MSQYALISQHELARQARLALEGKTLHMMLCSKGVSGFDENSSVAQWQTVEKSGNGYARFSGAVGVGAYDQDLGSYKLPEINATFTATGSYIYDRAVLYFDGETHLHSLIVEDAPVTLGAGQTQTYRVALVQDDW